MRMLRRLHFYAGVLVGPFLLIAAVSGGLYALAPAAEQLVYRTALHTGSTGAPHSLAEQVRAAQSRAGDLTVLGVRPPASGGETTRVLFADPALPEGTTRAIFVDPVTLDVRGDLASYGSSGSLPLRTWIDGLHRDLHLGETGRLYSEIAASWLWVIALAGVVLWIAHVRKRHRLSGTGRLLVVDGKSKRRERTLNWHGVTGLWIALALLFLSATGLTWSTYAGKNVAELREQLSWTQPVTATSLSGAAAPAGHDHDHGSGPAGTAGDDAGPVAQTDAALALARTAGIDARAVQIGYPASAGQAFTVTEVRAPWQFSPDSAAVDPDTGTVVDVNRFADWPLAAQLANLGIALHMGLLLGLLNQVILFAIAGALVVVIVRGYQMWWQRRRRGTRLPALPPARGGLRDLPLAGVLAIAVVAITIGWFIPLLGWPLLAFVVLDVALSLFQHFRTPPTPPAPPGAHTGTDAAGTAQPSAPARSASTVALTSQPMHLSVTDCP